MHRDLLGAGLVLFLVCGLPAARAQEPAYARGNPAMRWEQSPGVFHYKYSCQTQLEMAHLAQTASKSTGTPEGALCWPAWAMRMSKNGATFNASSVIFGRLVLSEHAFRFIPNEDKNADLYAEYRPQEIDIQHKAGEAFAFFGTKDVFFKFGFSNLCSSCPDGTKVPPTTNTALLDKEFEQLRESVRHSDSAKQQMTDLTSSIRIEIRSSNQPGVGDIPDSLRLYADLNNRFAELCPEPAKSCIRSFAAFEKCKSASWGAECGPMPMCSEACAITMEDLRKLNADACVQLDQQGASLSPDWTEVAKSKNKSNPPIRTLTPGVVELQPQPGPNFPASAGCTVSKFYERASMPSVGEAEMEGLGGAGGSPHAPRDIRMVAPKRVNIAAGVAVGMLVKKVQPDYYYCVIKRGEDNKDTGAEIERGG